MDARFEMLTRRIDAVDMDLREWARITMQHNTGICPAKDKAGLGDANRMTTARVSRVRCLPNRFAR